MGIMYNTVYLYTCNEKIERSKRDWLLSLHNSLEQLTRKTKLQFGETFCRLYPLMPLTLPGKRPL